MKTARLSWGLDRVAIKELSLSYHAFLIIVTEQLSRKNTGGYKVGGVIS